MRCGGRSRPGPEPDSRKPWAACQELTRSYRERVVSVLDAPRVHGGGTWERVRATCDALTLCQEANPRANE
jgi:hypothetical protein